MGSNPWHDISCCKWSHYCIKPSPLEITLKEISNVMKKSRKGHQDQKLLVVEACLELVKISRKDGLSKPPTRGCKNIGTQYQRILEGFEIQNIGEHRIGDWYFRTPMKFPLKNVLIQQERPDIGTSERMIPSKPRQIEILELLNKLIL